MTLEKIILDAKLINDNTDIWIRDCEFQALAHGNWYQDSVLDYMHNEIESFKVEIMDQDKFIKNNDVQEIKNLLLCSLVTWCAYSRRVIV